LHELDSAGPGDSVRLFLGGLERQRPFQTTSTNTGFGVERGRVILVPARLSGSFSEEVECVDEERTDSEVRSVRSVERYDGWRFVTPSWWAVAKYPLCQISRWQLVQAMQEQIWRILVATLFALLANSRSEP